MAYKERVYNTGVAQQAAVERKRRQEIEDRDARRPGESVTEWLLRKAHPDKLSSEEREYVAKMRKKMMYHEVTIGKRFVASCRSCGPLGVVKGTGALDELRREAQEQHLIELGYFMEEPGEVSGKGVLFEEIGK